MTETFDEYKELVKELNTQKQYYAANMINVLIERCKKAEMKVMFLKQGESTLLDTLDEAMGMINDFITRPPNPESISMNSVKAQIKLIQSTIKHVREFNKE